MSKINNIIITFMALSLLISLAYGPSNEAARSMPVAAEITEEPTAVSESEGTGARETNPENTTEEITFTETIGGLVVLISFFPLAIGYVMSFLSGFRYHSFWGLIMTCVPPIGQIAFILRHPFKAKKGSKLFIYSLVFFIDGYFIIVAHIRKAAQQPLGCYTRLWR